jgi:transcriptional regulator with XRE-family HTH domain
MSLFSDNIRHLRIKKDLSQEIVAESLSISRDSLAKYEQGRSQPPHEILIKLSHYYHVSIDLLLTADIRKINLESLLKMDDNRILLPIVVDKSGNNIIEVVPHKAKAGYFTGYSDPEFHREPTAYLAAVPGYRKIQVFCRRRRFDAPA